MEKANAEAWLQSMMSSIDPVTPEPDPVTPEPDPVTPDSLDAVEYGPFINQAYNEILKRNVDSL